MLLLSSRSPIVLIPGTMDNHISITTDRDLPNLKRVVNETFFPDISWFLPPKLPYLLKFLSVDEDLQTEYARIFPKDFGSTEPLEYVFGQSILGNLVKKLESVGYKKGFDLFGAGYDWRLGVLQEDEYFENLKELIENAVRNTGKKVSIISFSLGGWIQHSFLHEKTTAEWRSANIAQANFVGPSWSGSGMCTKLLHQKKIPYIPFFRFPELRSIPMCHLQIPNAEAYNDTIIIDFDDGTKLNGKEALDFIRSELNPTERKIAEKSWKYADHIPEQLDVPVKIIYNSAVPTSMGLSIKWWDQDGWQIRVDGDGVVGAEGIKKVCSSWNNTECKNLNDKKINHLGLVNTESSIEQIIKWAVLDYNALSQEHHTFDEI